MAGPMVTITNLGEFTAAVSKAVAGSDAALNKGIAAAGQPVLSRAQELSPSRRVAAAGHVEVHGSEGQIVFEKDWAETAEWSKKPGWMAHGAPGRYGRRALREKGPDVEAALDRAMEAVITLNGWAG